MSGVLGFIVFIVILAEFLLPGGADGLFATILTVLILIVGLVLLVKLIKYIVKTIRLRRWTQAAAERDRQYQEYANERIREANVNRQALFNRYLASGQEILADLCVGNPYEKPFQITIYNDRVDAEFENMARSFSFRRHGIAELDGVFIYASIDDYSFESNITICPQLVLAEALNQLMGNIYDVKDAAEFDEVSHEDEIYFRYASNYVVLQLKPTRKL